MTETTTRPLPSTLRTKMTNPAREQEVRAGRKEWTGLAVLALLLLLVSMDVSVLYFAVPRSAHRATGWVERQRRIVARHLS